jgi:ribosomal-protein-alanine N-acetyltransferase
VRLMLTPFSAQDRDATFAILSDARVATFLGYEPLTDSEQAAALIAGVIDESAAGNAYHWALRLRDDGTLIGSCNLYCDRNRRRGEVGIYLGRPWWGQGYAREALREVLAFGFESQGLNRIEALIYTENVASRALVRSLGFTEEGILREHAWEHGRYWDDVIVSLLAREFNREG